MMRTSHAIRPRLGEDVFAKSNVFFRHVLDRRFFLTEGVRYLARSAYADWLIDTIVLAQGRIEIVLPDFQIWRFEREGESGGRLTCRDGMGVLRYTQTLHWTDIPFSTLELWLDGNVLGLPTEACD